MFSPKYQAMLSKECFPGDNCICLGPQLVLILEALKDFLPAHTWYGGDVEAVGNGVSSLNAHMGKTHKIGNDQDFIRYCNLVDQFRWGDFLCIDNAFLPQNIESIELLTEDDQFRPIACEGILLEIQAFDTSFFAIYSENQEIQNIISRAFHPVELTIGQRQTEHWSKNTDIGKLISDLGMNLAEAELGDYEFFTKSNYFCMPLIFRKRKQAFTLSFSDVAKVMFSSIKRLSEITFGKEDDEFFTTALSELDEKNLPLVNDYQLFCFLDDEKKPFLKIVARTYHLKVC